MKCPCSPPASTSPWTFPPQKYNADYDLSARQGADTLAFMSLLEEKLLPVLVSAQALHRHTHTHTHTQHGNQNPTLSQAGAVAQTSLFLPTYPMQIHTFWIDAKNYVEVTRKWYAEAMPFPLNFFLPGRMQRQYMERLQLLCGEHRPEDEEELEKEVPLGRGVLYDKSPQDDGRGAKCLRGEAVPNPQLRADLVSPP